MNLKKFNLSNKLALITGGAGFLGTQHALALSELGCNIFLLDNNYKSLLKKKILFKKRNININIIRLDITKELEIKKSAQFILKKFKKIDILINNAAIDFKPNNKNSKNQNKFESFSLQQWLKELNVGLTGAFLCSKIFGSEMAKNKNGVIVNISSDLSVIAPDQRLYKHLNSFKPITYSIIKYGIIGLTKYLATYWAKDNIRVNALSPGGIKNNQDKIFIQKIKKLIPLKRMANKEEYHGAIQFLCTDASSYMTGQNLVIDGGRSVL
jgi:NAD(P)-dependent dehydrogenase (short-subunit alcohol dehydrogenase family)